MRAPAPVGQGAAASEAGNALCFLCSRKNPGPLGNTMPHVEKKRGRGRKRKKRKGKGNKCIKVREQALGWL